MNLAFTDSRLSRWPRTSRERHRITIWAPSPDGRAWELTIEQAGGSARPARQYLDLTVHQDSWDVLDGGAPDLLAGLRKVARGSLDGVRALLERLGARDETGRSDTTEGE